MPAEVSKGGPRYQQFEANTPQLSNKQGKVNAYSYKHLSLGLVSYRPIADRTKKFVIYSDSTPKFIFLHLYLKICIYKAVNICVLCFKETYKE